MTRGNRPGSARRFHLVVYSDAVERGGAEVNLSRVLGALPAELHVTLVGVDAEVVDWLAQHRPGADREVLPAVVDRSDAAGLRRHRSAFVRLAPDVVQFNLSSASSCQWAIAAATTVPGLRRVVVENSPMGTWSRSSSALKRWTSARLAAHVAVGERTARLIEESSGLVPGSIATLYHGVPRPERAPVERGEEPTLLTVARHDPVKGLDVLLRAMALVPAPTRAVVLGSGSETAQLEALRDQLGLAERVELRSLPWDVRAADLMWAYDGLVLPSRLEGFPVTIVEAMLAGIPVVATEVGSVLEAVRPGDTGWVVPPEDPVALAAAVVALVADRPAARVLGERGQREATERFTIEATVRSYLHLYRSLWAPGAWSWSWDPA
jgi:glycosyltransferase involved in cell wall biosynthesis